MKVMFLDVNEVIEAKNLLMTYCIEYTITDENFNKIEQNKIVLKPTVQRVYTRDDNEWNIETSVSELTSDFESYYKFFKECNEDRNSFIVSENSLKININLNKCFDMYDLESFDLNIISFIDLYNQANGANISSLESALSATFGPKTLKEVDINSVNRSDLMIKAINNSSKENTTKIIKRMRNCLVHNYDRKTLYNAYKESQNNALKEKASEREYSKELWNEYLNKYSKEYNKNSIKVLLSTCMYRNSETVKNIIDICIKNNFVGTKTLNDVDIVICDDEFDLDMYKKAINNDNKKFYTSDTFEEKYYKTK